MELLLAMAAGFFISTFVVSRGLVAYDTWNEAVRLESRDAWMREQCRNQTFFANMRVHSDVCEVVQRNAGRAPWVHSLYAAMQTEVSWWPVMVGGVLIAAQCAGRWRKLATMDRNQYISIA
jgi:hypothetical protein